MRFLGCFFVCDRRHHGQRPSRSAPAIVDLRHPPDAAVAVASPVTVASASKPPPFTYRTLNFVRKTIKACRFSRSSRVGSAGEDLVSERRECEAQGPEIQAQSEISAEKSREGVEEAENARWPTIEAQSGEESREGVEEAENARWPTIEVQSGEESREGMEEADDAPWSTIEAQSCEETAENAPWPTIEAQSGEQSREGVEEADNTRWPTIEAQSGEQSREGVEEADNTRWPTIEAQSGEESREGVEEAETAHWSAIEARSDEEIMGVGFMGELQQTRELSGRDENEGLGIVEDSLRTEISESIGALSSQLKEGETIGSSGVQLEEGEIIDSPRTEVDTGLEDGGIIDSPGTEVEEGEIIDSPRSAIEDVGAELEDGEIIDSPRPAFEDVRAELEDGEIIDYPSAEVAAGDKGLEEGEIVDSAEEGEIVDSPGAEGSPPLSEQIADCMKQSRELLERRTNSDATKALELISKALSISMHSENLLEMKAEALLMMHSYEDVIQICEKNYVTTDIKDGNSCGNQKVTMEKLWRLHLMAKAYFYMGRFEEAMELLQKHEEVEPVTYMSGNMLTESSKSLSVKITKLLGFRAVGNEAFQSKRFSEAVEHYTAALAFSVESRPFSAICFYSRAIANEELGNVVDAIADCSLAIVLDQRYIEAISRRATLHELIRDYEQAVNDQKMLISILENETKGQDYMFRVSKGLCKRQRDLEQARLRLCTLKEHARKRTRKDIYKILGVGRSSSMIDVKNAYRRAALKHHPDKSGLLLIKSENVNNGLWREVVDQVHIDADKLFKLIGEAYAVLSNASKRQEYDEEEDEGEMVWMWSSNGSFNPYDFNQEYEQRRNPYDFNQGRSYGCDFSQGFEQRRYEYDFTQGYDFNRGSPSTGNERCQQKSRANDQQRANTSYFNRGDPRSSSGSYGQKRSDDYKQRRNGPDFRRGYDQRSSTRYEERSSNF